MEYERTELESQAQIFLKKIGVYAKTKEYKYNELTDAEASTRYIESKIDLLGVSSSEAFYMALNEMENHFTKINHQAIGIIEWN